MANGSELKEYRQKIMSAIINDKDICELVLDRTISEIDSDIQDELTDKYIFKYAFVPDSIDEENTYITFDLSAQRMSNSPLFKNITLSFFMFSHHNIMRYSTGDLRTDLIDERIQSLFNENRDFGFGIMYCESDSPLRIGNAHYGRQLSFKVKDQSVTRCY